MTDAQKNIAQEGILCLPANVIFQILSSYGIRGACRAALVCRGFNRALGGTYGSGDRLAQQIHKDQLAEQALEKEAKAREQSSRALVDAGRERTADPRLRMTAAIISLRQSHGQHGIGFRTVAVRFRVSQRELRYIYGELMADRFFMERDWESSLMEHPLLEPPDPDSAD